VNLRLANPAHSCRQKSHSPATCPVRAAGISSPISTSWRARRQPLRSSLDCYWALAPSMILCRCFPCPLATTRGAPDCVIVQARAAELAFLLHAHNAAIQKCPAVGPVAPARRRPTNLLAIIRHVRQCLAELGTPARNFDAVAGRSAHIRTGGPLATQRETSVRVDATRQDSGGGRSEARTRAGPPDPPGASTLRRVTARAKSPSQLSMWAPRSASGDRR